MKTKLLEKAMNGIKTNKTGILKNMMMLAGVAVGLVIAQGLTIKDNDGCQDEEIVETEAEAIFDEVTDTEVTEEN